MYSLGILFSLLCSLKYHEKEFMHYICFYLNSLNRGSGGHGIWKLKQCIQFVRHRIDKSVVCNCFPCSIGRNPLYRCLHTHICNRPTADEPLFVVLSVIVFKFGCCWWVISSVLLPFVAKIYFMIYIWLYVWNFIVWYCS